MEEVMKGYVEDPELQDENDPEYQEEMFQLFKYLGWKPEHIKDVKYAKLYEKWLSNDGKSY